MKKIFILSVLTVLFFINKSYSQYTDNYALSLNGVNAYCSVPNAPDLNPVAAITLEAWVNPSAILGTTMGVIGKNYQTGYFLGVQASGRVVFYPKGGASLRSRAFNVVPANQWTHIAGVYDGTNTQIYINGILDTSTTAISGLVGSNTDSLFIGADRVGATPSLFFFGKIDNVRIWALARNGAVMADHKFIPLEVFAPTGYYEHLRASFQLDNNLSSYSGSDFHSGFSRNLSFVNYSNKAVNYQDYNNSLVLNGLSDYFTVFNTSGSGFNPTTAITLEAWIRRDTTGTQPNDMYIVNKSGGTDRYDYALWLHAPTGILKFKINSPGGPAGIISSTVITNAQWTHVTATYNSATGFAYLYINGNLVAAGIFTGNPAINNSPDNLYIGGIGASTFAAGKFKGQIDAVRIWGIERSAAQIKDNMYKYLNSESDLTHFDFDKFTNAIYSQNSRIYTSNTFGGLAHISSSHLNKNNELTSPLLSDEAGGFYSTGYTSSYKRFFVPDNILTGPLDSIFVSASGTITNLKVYLLMSHTYMSDMIISIVSPSGTEDLLFTREGGNGNDIATIFSDAAESNASEGTLVNNPGINPPFSPGIKPRSPLSVFNGENKLGWWKLKIMDVVSADIGYVHGWGVNIAGASNRTLHLSAFIQGFYKQAGHKMVKDTARVILRTATSPFVIVDTAKAVLDSVGKGVFVFDNAVNGTPYYIVIDHRNSIETWSGFTPTFNTDVMNYDFTFQSSQAYGNNMIYVDALLTDEANEKNKDDPEGSIERYAIYNGNANRDGSVNLTDIILIANDASNFVTGYINTDMTGDNAANLSDILIAFNNSNNFVSVVRP